MEDLASRLPDGYGYDGPARLNQESSPAADRGNFGMAIVFVFLVLAALYESWAVPFAVLLGIPFAVLGAYLG